MLAKIPALTNFNALRYLDSFLAIICNISQQTAVFNRFGNSRFDANAVVREEPSEEFMKEITEAAELYNKKTSQSDKELRLDLQIKIQLKKEAIEALPENFQGCRISFDKFTAPLDRTPPTETPPIPGFRLFKEGEAPE